ncbi:uncharacterized protein LOC133029135 [Cannabis sativa]|uniref:uncharacterized protein LOC133029135 n=1 Tax=Cannabis sativa TaxID=3483 RepID=UPI0029C9D7BC|nr:uncharacterized protein LOC133029135 [Cannabis sativa]
MVNMVESLASELAKSIQYNDTMIEKLKSLIDDDDYDQCHKHREILKVKFNQLLIQCFSPSYAHEFNFKILNRLNKFTLFLLETKFKDMKEQEHDLMLELNNFGINNDDDSVLRSLTRKLKLIKHYYLSKQVLFLLLLPIEASFDDSLELRVKNKKKTMFGLRNRIRELMIERRNEIVKAQSQQGNNKFSFIELVSLDLDQEDEFITLCMIHSVIIEIGDRLCSNLCDLMFVVSENLLLYGKWNVLKQVLKSLMQQHHQEKHTNVIKRILFVIGKAEKELKQIFEPFEDNSDDDDNGFSDDDERKIDQAFDMILRIILCLDSIIRYPSLSISSKLEMKKDLKCVMNGVNECKKELGKIRLEVCGLKKHFVTEKTKDEVLMQEYQTTMRVWIG